MQTLTPEEIFNKLPEDISKKLKSVGYLGSSLEFANLVNAVNNSLRKCDEKSFIESLVSESDRYKLKIKLEGILKKLDLNAEDEFMKFQVKVIEVLTDQFSLFAKFQMKVLAELYKIGIPQIPEVSEDFFQILNPVEHKADLEEMRDIFRKTNYDRI